MNKYLRKNGKKIMAVLGVLLMVAFALPTATNFSRVEATLGTINNGKTTLSGREFNRYMQQWQLLKQDLGAIEISTVLGGASQLGEEAVVAALSEPQTAMKLQQLATFRQRNPGTYFQLLQMMPDIADLSMLEGRGESAYVQIEESPELFMLLAKEAESMGVGANDDLIQTILQRRGVTADEDPARHAALHDALRTLLSINNTAALASSVVKASQPERTHLMATQRQQLSVGLVEFNAKDFLDKVPAPTAEQVKAQFDKYKNVDPEAAGSDPSNPLGFGYKYPNRVKYDAILIKKDDVRKGVPPVEPEDAAEYYLRNKGEFTASTQPTTQDSFSLGAGPTTRQLSLTESRERIVKTLTDRRSNELMTKVRDAVRSTMKADYDAYRAATGGAATRPTTGTASAAPASSLGVPYNSYEYLKKLRDKIQADHKVTLTIEQQDAWQTPKELEESKLGKNGFSIQDLGLTFPRFMTSRVAPFLGEDQRKELSSRGAENKPVDVWEATPVFTDITEDLLIARATAAEPTHAPASLDEVKDRVAADVKLAAAYEQAKKAAQALVDATKAGKWLSAVAASQGKKVITTGLFGAQESGIGGPLPVTGYDLKGRALGDFVQGAYKLLAQAPRPGGSAPRVATTQASAATQPATTQANKSPTTAPAVAAAAFKDHPVGLIEVPADAKVLAAEVEQLKPTWTKDREGFFNAQASAQARFRNEQELRQAWYQYDNVAARLDYHPTDKRERKTPRQNVPINPFTGTAMP